jgi:hypothetical protein
MIGLELPWVPPTSNHAYTNGGFGGRVLAKEGRAFLAKTKAHLAQHYPKELRLFQPNKPYAVLLLFYFKDVETKGYAKGKAGARYKVFDGGNRTKLLEDALKDAGGVDDSQTMISMWQKVYAGTGPERTRIFVWSMEEERTPFDDLLRQLY